MISTFVRCALALPLLFAFGCQSLESSAAKDPRKCERDPKCMDKTRAADCDTQCNYSPDCTQRCQEMNASSGATDAR